MITINNQHVKLSIDENKLSGLSVIGPLETKKTLFRLWDIDAEYLPNYYALFFNKAIQNLSASDAFITLAFKHHGYLLNTTKPIDIQQAKKQIETDLLIINQESNLSKATSIYFDKWWPKPHFDHKTAKLDFGVALKTHNGQSSSHTINRIILLRYGHLTINYSLSKQAIQQQPDVKPYLALLNEITQAIAIDKGYRFSDIDREKDQASNYKIINLLLSSEIF